MRQKPPTKAALTLAATFTLLVALAGCAPCEWDIHYPDPAFSAPESPIGKPIYPSSIRWIWAHAPIRYGQTVAEIKANLEQMEPMCGVRFTLAPTAWPWVRPLPVPSFHGSATFQGHYHEVLLVYQTGTYVAAAVAFDQEDRAMFFYNEGAFDIPFLQCLPGDEMSIKEIRAKEPPLALEGLDTWLPVEAKIFDGMHHVRTKEDVQRLCAEALINARQGYWKLSEGPLRIAPQDDTLDDTLICMMGNLRADKFLSLWADDGLDGSFYPLFHIEQHPSKYRSTPFIDHCVFTAYLLNDRVVGVEMEKRLFPVLSSTLFTTAAEAEWLKRNKRIGDGDSRICFPTEMTFWKNN